MSRLLGPSGSASRQRVVDLEPSWSEDEEEEQEDDDDEEDGEDAVGDDTAESEEENDDDDDDDDEDEDIGIPQRVRISYYPDQPLSDPSAQLRILHIMPSSDVSSTVHAKLTTVPINATGQYAHTTYEALSYTWGASSSKFVVLNSRTFPVTDNLAVLLCRLRRERTPRNLWIDALCINQMDRKERSRQVAIMDQMYKRARRTIVWLGDFSPGIRRFDSAPANVASALAAALRNTKPSWWTRTWTIQEAIVSVQEPYFCFGSFCIPWQSIIDHVRRIGIPESRGLGIVLERLQALRQRYQLGNLSFRACLDAAQGTNAADPRDRVFSLLSLVRTQDQQTYYPDYNVSCAVFYGFATNRIIRESGNLGAVFNKFITGMTRPPSSSKDAQHMKSAPSWVIDLLTVTSTLDCAWPFCQPGPPMRPIFRPMLAQSAAGLSCEGIYVDEIVRIAALHHNQAGSDASWDRYQNAILSFIRRSNLAPTLTKYASRSRSDERLPNFINGTVLFATRGGLVGIAPASMRLGDTLALLDNTWRPAVLRQHQDKWQLAGFACIPDFPNQKWPRSSYRVSDGINYQQLQTYGLI